MARDPYSIDLFPQLRHELRMEFAVNNPRALAKVTPISYDFRRDVLWIVRNPSFRWARSWREFGRQLLDIFRHEFWMAQGRPERAPGAIPVTKMDVGAGW